MSWNLEDHILDHAALVSNNLPSYFNLADDKNIHFTFSIDKSQLIAPADLFGQSAGVIRTVLK